MSATHPAAFLDRLSPASVAQLDVHQTGSGD